MSSGIGNTRAQAQSKLGDRSIYNVLRLLVPFGSQRFTQMFQVSYITTGIDFFYHETFNLRTKALHFAAIFKLNICKLLSREELEHF